MLTADRSGYALFRRVAGLALAAPWRWMGRIKARPQPRDPWMELAHFDSLDDQLLYDLGLQRAELQAAEYGILPAKQALHQEDEEAEADAADNAKIRGFEDVQEGA